ncbi:hypothetical protein D3C77_372160 [compost metagenome]
MVLMHVALAAQTQIRDRVKQEVVTQLVHSGYALYLVAGCAYFGAYAFSGIASKEHAPFGLIWLLLLTSLLLLEFIKARLDPPKNTFSFSRRLSIPTALLFIYWVSVGASWPG